MSKRRTYFITGTDTGVGKTLVSAALLHGAAACGARTLGLKPVAAGCEPGADGLRNEDALSLAAHSSVKLSYAQINPIALPEPLSPHIAAARAGKRLTAGRIVGFCRGAMGTAADFCIVEGAGGWRVPINERETMADLAIELALPVIVTVGMRLGCLNHALLTSEALLRDGMQVVGWVANVIDPEMAALSENIDTLRARLPFPMLGRVPFLANPNPVEAAAHIDISKLWTSPQP